MTTNVDKDPQTHDRTPVNANADKTPAGNVSTVTADTVILDQMKEMFASAQKKLDEQGKLVASLAKNVETLTAKARSKALRGTTRAHSGRRVDFETPGNRAAQADKASSGQNPDETLQPGAQPTAENLPPPTESNEGEEIERIDLDISDQSDHSDDGADIHPRRTRSQRGDENSLPEVQPTEDAHKKRKALETTSMSTTREKTSKASTTTLSIPNKERPPETPGPGTSTRITPTASSTRPKVIPLRTAKFSRDQSTSEQLST
ncbi:hypothetical protein F2Q68_00004914 [Brassica cretica]|uniref:Uncharacterized protein n=1 Tax=Brassica cretica TaxID=69181 RepID=A0A8S9JB20_BRACR|nr:hypothetical protein F2Q68_00004914 [Brassica cretica]